MLAVHRFQNAVGAGLHGQMHVRHQRRQLGMCRYQVVIHVARMTGGVAQTQYPGHLREAPQQFSER